MRHDESSAQWNESAQRAQSKKLIFIDVVLGVSINHCVDNNDMLRRQNDANDQRRACGIIIRHTISD